MTRIVTGLFKEHRAVDLAVEHLVQEFGIPRERIQVHAADSASGQEARSPQDDDQEVSLAELGMSDEAARAYGEAMRRGSILLAERVDDADRDHALATFREYGGAEVRAGEAAPPPAAGEPEESTRIRAYHLWEQAGRPEGRDLEFWLAARR